VDVSKLIDVPAGPYENDHSLELQTIRDCLKSTDDTGALCNAMLASKTFSGQVNGVTNVLRVPAYFNQLVAIYFGDKTTTNNNNFLAQAKQNPALTMSMFAAKKQAACNISRKTPELNDAHFLSCVEIQFGHALSQIKKDIGFTGTYNSPCTLPFPGAKAIQGDSTALPVDNSDSGSRFPTVWVIVGCVLGVVVLAVFIGVVIYMTRPRVIEEKV